MITCLGDSIFHTSKPACCLQLYKGVVFYHVYTRNTHAHHASRQMYTMYMYMLITIAIIHVCLSGLWLGGLLHLSFLSDFLKLYSVLCTCISTYWKRKIIILWQNTA